MSLGFLLLIVVALLLVGAVPTWRYSSGWGYGPSGVLGLVLAWCSSWSWWADCDAVRHRTDFLTGCAHRCSSVTPMRHTVDIERDTRSLRPVDPH